MWNCDWGEGLRNEGTCRADGDSRRGAALVSQGPYLTGSRVLGLEFDADRTHARVAKFDSV